MVTEGSRVTAILKRAWQSIRNADIRWLPIDPFLLAGRLGVRVISASQIVKNEHVDPKRLDKERGAFLLVHRKKCAFTIVYDDQLRPEELLRWTILRELGHIRLGHITALERGGFPPTRTHQHIREAERFAAEVLAPPPLLRATGATRREAIAYVCGIPESVAEEREHILKNYDETYRKAEEWMRQQFADYLKPVAYCASSDGLFGLWGMTKRNPEGKPMNRQHAYVETDEKGRFLRCPRCGNRNFSEDAKYCKMCGIYLFNKCTNQSQYDEHIGSDGWCGRINPGDARYCEHCGAETILTKLGLLKPWQEVMIPKKEVATSRVPDPMEENDGKPIEISGDEIPF
jgi:Zn-dependent peptidase ImmA (M78 family)